MNSPPASSSGCSSMSSPPVNFDEKLKSELSLDGMQFGDGHTDPLDILLQTISNAEHIDSSATATSPDWTQMSHWGTGNEKQADFSSEFDFSLPMDLDFNSNMAVDPSALHFNPSMFAPQNTNDVYRLSSNDFTSDFISASMFPFESGANTWNGTTNGRRLSVTSSSSSSGASLSPVMSNQSAVASSASSDSGHSESDPASELAHRVRQIAGVTLAVPVSAQVQQLAAAGGQTKLPIPRLHRPSPPPVQKRLTVKPSPSSESLSSVPSPSREASGEQSTPPPASSPEPPSSVSASPPPTSATGRPKTSHTTIERRYRTNLNARITGLKQAVPALRVLEVKNGAPNVFGDVVDDRGIVDGVKVARKMSKANVLGKATEYIRVLKKRETRLKREQDGLKSLVSGLVGGPALLKEWEREWRDRFGGEEKDEIEDELLQAGSDDEDGDGEDSDGEDDEGRSRKKAKVSKAAAVKKERPPKPPPAPVSTVPGAVPEKRKRGRPRKNPLPVAPAAAAVPPPIMPVAYPTGEQPIQPMPMSMAIQQDMSFQQQQQQQQPVQSVVPEQPTQQYLLAVFAFFSIFNSPLTSSYTRPTAHTHHSHHGVVLSNNPIGPYAIPVMPPSPSYTFYGYGMHELIQAFHLLVSTMVLFYVVIPWLSGALRQRRIWSMLSHLSSYFSQPYTHSHTTSGAANPIPAQTPDATGSLVEPLTKSTTDIPERSKLMEALAPSRRGASDEAVQLRSCLGVSTGLVGLMQGVIKAVKHDRGIELNQLEQRAWVRLGELVAFDGGMPRTTRLQTYWCMSCHISTYSASTTDLTTLALIIRPVSRSKAAALWEQARQRVVRPYENIVLSNMDVDEAAEWLERWRQWHITERKGRCAACEKRTPLGVLAAILLRARLRKHAALMFVRTVVPQGPRNVIYDSEKEYKDEKERKETIEAGKSIGGRTAELAVLLERIWDTGFCSQEDVFPPSRETPSGDSLDDEEDCEDEHDLASTDEAEIRSLLSATLIYRRIFPSSFPNCAPSVSVILSPPPSPSRKNILLHVALRTALGNPAFDDSFGRLDEKLGASLEDARDRVVDMLVELERAGRRNGRYQ